MIATLEKDSPSTTGTCALGFSGISFQPSSVLFSSALNASNKDFLHSWIIDSGATDHMTNSSKQFVSYNPCLSNRKIIVADGSIMTVAGQGDVSINSTLVLRNVLHVPKLCTSLISVQKLATDSNVFVIFSSNSCILQEQETKQMIGLAKEKDGLYFFKSMVNVVELRVYHLLLFKLNV